MTPDERSRMATRDPRAPVGQAPISCYVALGDSFTAGTGCPPGSSWADRLARSLRRDHDELVYRNFAAEGATSADVLERMQPALRLEPDLVTAICGANDVLESVRPDPDAVAARLGQIFDQLQEVVPGALVITATVPEKWNFLEMGPRTRRRVMDGLQAVNRNTREVAAARGIPCLEVNGHPGLDDSENFSADGLHPSPLGHQRAAEAFEALLTEARQ
jgi:lysophospholipase L1-like esterase